MIKIGRKNQLYGKWKRLLPNPDNDKEIYLVIEKDKPMELKYIRQFENMFKGKDIILSITTLVRGKPRWEETPSEEIKVPSRKRTIDYGGESPFWVSEEEEDDEYKPEKGAQKRIIEKKKRKVRKKE